MTTSVTPPAAWYNVLADLDFDLPPDLPPPVRPDGARLDPQVPLSLIRQEVTRERWIPIPEEVARRYAQWRVTPLRRATEFERALGTRARIYYKYEGGNPSGSHKLNTAIAQAHYYKAAGAKRLAVATGAGQWGTAVATACHMFGLECVVYMVRTSLENKPHRRTIMEMLGAEVIASPSDTTAAGRRFAHEHAGTLSIALAEAMEATRQPGTRFCAGSGETYSLLHNTVMGLEAIDQLTALGERADVVVAGLGAGSNFAGLAFPFLRQGHVRCVSVEPAACPKLTRGRYAYDFTDSSEQNPLQKMYTLGSRFAPPRMHAGGLRYHATAKVISALYDRGALEATAYQQREVFESAVRFARSEGVVPAPESAHAVHGAVVEAAKADRDGTSPVILFSLSGHGLFDMTSYRSYLDGEVDEEIVVTDADIERSLEHLPPQPEHQTAGV